MQTNRPMKFRVARCRDKVKKIDMLQVKVFQCSVITILFFCVKVLKKIWVIKI